MRRVIWFLLVLMLVGSLCACAPTVDTQQPQNNGNTNVDAGENGEQSPAPVDVAIEETVLVDEADIKITAKSIDSDGFLGAELKILIENNSNKNLTVQTRSASVNGYMMEAMISADVAAGKKANEAITFMRSELELCGIETIADMEFSFHIFKTDDWDTYLDTDPIAVKTSAAEGYAYTYNHEGKSVYEDKGLKIVFKELTVDSLLGPQLVMYLHNTGEKSVTVQTREVSINGFMVEPVFSAEVAPGKHAVSGITFMSSELEDNGIEKISNVELSFHIFNTETWNTIADTDVIALALS